MERENVVAAVLEAQRFLARAEKYLSLTKDTFAVEPYDGGKPYKRHVSCPPLESGAIRRSSMDLSRSLSKLRRP